MKNDRVYYAFRAYFSFVLDHPYLTLAFLCLFFVGCGFGVTQVRTDFSPDSIFRDDPAREMRDHVVEMFGDTDDTVMVMVHAPNGVFQPTVLDAIHELTLKFENVDHAIRQTSITNATYFTSAGDNGFDVGPVLGPPPHTPEHLAAAKQAFVDSDFFIGTLLNEALTVTAVVVEVEEGREGDQERLALTREVTEMATSVLADNPLISEWHVAGIPVVQAEYLKIAKRDQFIFIGLVGAFFIVILIFLFKNSIGVLSPVLVSTASIIATLAWMGYTDIAINMLSTATPTVIAIYGIADAIHILVRYREELLHGLGKREAIIEAMTHLGRACFLTSFTTAIGFLSLAFSRNQLVQEFGMTTGLGVMIAYVLSIVMMPPMMWLLPEMRVNNRKRREAGDTHPHGDWIGRSLGGLSHWIVRNRLAVLLITFGFIATAVGVSTLVQRETYLLEELKASNPVTRAYNFTQENVTGLLDFEVYLRTEEEGGVMEPEVLEVIDKIEHWMSSQEEITGTYSLATFMRAMNRAFHNDNPEMAVVPDNRPLAAQYRLLYDISNDDEDKLRPYVNATGTEARILGMRYDVGDTGYAKLKERFEAWAATNLPQNLGIQVVGTSMLVSESVKFIVDDMLMSIGMAFLIISIVLSISFRSVALGFLAMVPNVLPLLACLAVMGASGIMLRTATVIVFSVALGIAVDDTIHFIARYAEEIRKKGNAVESVHMTMMSVGRAMLSTSALLIGGFSVLLTSDFLALNHFGLLVTVAVLTAIFADLVVTPMLLQWVKPGERWFREHHKDA